MKKIIFALSLIALGASAFAKLPPPSDEAKAKAGKPAATPPCADPGKFVYTPPEATPTAAAPATTAPGAAPAAAPATAPTAASAKKS